MYQGLSSKHVFSAVLNGSLYRGAAVTELQDQGDAEGHEDIPGVPARAWVRVVRGVPPADPYTPGEQGGVGLG